MSPGDGRRRHTALARTLTQRCRDLHRQGLDAATAERLTFAEFLAEPSGRPSSSPNLYEHFLQAYAPEQRRARGVYYTPAPVVAAQVRLAADLLVARLGCHSAFADERVLVVDPATGSGAYPLAVMADTRPRVPEAAQTLARRMRLFEPLAGAACLVRAHGFDVVEGDVLTMPIDLDAPIVVCLGNPPYRRARRPTAGPDFADSLRVPGQGVHLKNAYNDYVYFWCWALRAVFEQRRGPGIISFLSASSYVRGPGFAGLRQLLRRELDELWILDLEGDQLAARRTDNVFAIRTPVAIALGVRYAEAHADTLATVHYTRLTGDRRTKLAELDRLRHLSDLTCQTVGGDWPAALVPHASNAYQHWVTLTELFPWQISGAQLKRTWPIGPLPELLRQRWDHLLGLRGRAQTEAFYPTRDRDLDSRPPDLRDPARHLDSLRSLNAGEPCVDPVRYAYRSFDRQWVLPDARLGDFMRPALWRMAGPRQIYLTSLLTTILGAGPAAVATALVPDLDHFRGSFGARAVIPLWRDAEAAQPNVATTWLDQLAARFGTSIDAETLLAYCYAVLGNRGYVKRFEHELRTPGPRVPFPDDPALFARAAALGRRLLWLHTFGARYVPPRECIAGLPTSHARCIRPPGPDYPTWFAYDPVECTLRVGDGLFGPLHPAVWAYSVSGLQVIAAWLRQRVRKKKPGRSPLDGLRPNRWTPSLTQELLEITWVLAATVALEPRLDALLEKIVSGPLYCSTM
ncbi:MAG: N-6 DNA methylase [Chloroflexi bacterium]|nr:N-6 DNA methylase [Chloroflexota bacterium]